jgi:hypothetical protein
MNGTKVHIKFLDHGKGSPAKASAYLLDKLDHQGIVSLAILVTAGSLATQFYLKSVQTKSEVKAEIFTEMEKEGKGFYNKKEVDDLVRDIKIVNEWINKNPKDSRGLLQYRDGKLSK